MNASEFSPGRDARTPPASGSSAMKAPGRSRRTAWLAFSLLVAVGSGVVFAIPWLGWRWTTPTIERVETLIASKRYSEAVDEAEALRKANPDENPRVLYALARAKAGLEDLEGAVEALREIPDWSRRKPEALFFSGKALMKLHRGRDAEQAYLACISRQDSGSTLASSARLELMALYAMEERVDEFRSIFWETYPRLSEADRLPVLTMRMRIEFEQAQPEINERSLRPFVKTDPDDGHALAGLAAALMRSNQLSEARAFLARAVNLIPSDPEIRERYLEVLHQTGDLSALETVLAARSTGSEHRPKIQKFLGIVSQAKGDLPAAESAFRRAIELDPNEAEYHHRLSQVLFQQGKPDAARAEAAERARLNQARESFRKTWNRFADLFETHPEKVHAEMLLGMAQACEKVGLSREAAAWSAEAGRLGPGDTPRSSRTGSSSIR